MENEKKLRSAHNTLLKFCEDRNLPVRVYFVLGLLVEVIYNAFLHFSSIPDLARINRLVMKYKKSPKSKSKRIAVVTGANSGIGYETAVGLVEADFDVIIACRSEEKAVSAIEAIKRSTGKANVSFMSLDLSSLKSVKQFVEQYAKAHDKLDLLIANAGVMACPYGVTQDGIEKQFGTNHIGHFALINGLIPQLKAAAPSKIVILSSHAQFHAQKIDYARISDKNMYDPTANYAISKLANQLYATSLAEKYGDSGIQVFSVHPGLINTPLYRHYPGYLSGFANFLMGVFLISPKFGALTSLQCALSDDKYTDSGVYFSKQLQFRQHPEAKSEKARSELWEFSDILVEKALAK